MQKFFLILALVFVFSFPDGFSQNRSIRFNEKPWKEIVEMAKKENKMIFLDAYASWCGPCKWMAANMFTNDTIADYYNKTFICASVDMEKGEGLTLRQKYAVRAYPSLLFINGNEEMVHERVGAPQKVRDYIEMARVAQIPEEGLAAYMRKYNAGNNSPEFIQSYLNRLVEAYIPINIVLKKYFATQSESDLLNRLNWNIIYRYVIDMDDPQFGYLLKRQDEYGKLYSRDSVIEKIGSIYDYALQKYTRISKSAKNDSSYVALKSQIINSGFEGAGKIIFNSDLQLFRMRENNDAYVRLLYDGLDKYYSKDYAKLINAAYTVLSLTDDDKYLEKAGEWAKRSISMKSGPYNNDIYASILFKLGKYKEAISYEEDAIELARKLNEPTARFEEALKKLQEHK
jgi:thiol-disulfide isomerase/thioredoxin